MKLTPLSVTTLFLGGTIALLPEFNQQLLGVAIAFILINLASRFLEQ
jgi:hypothetical protein